MVAATRLVAGSICQTEPKAPRTHTPLIPAPTASGRPERLIVATTRLFAGSIRLNLPSAPRVSPPQHTTQTPSAPTAGGASVITGMRATTLELAGSMRRTPVPCTEAQTAPDPAASPTTG